MASKTSEHWYIHNTLSSKHAWCASHPVSVHTSSIQHEVGCASLFHKWPSNRAMQMYRSKLDRQGILASSNASEFYHINYQHKCFSKLIRRFGLHETIYTHVKTHLFVLTSITHWLYIYHAFIYHIVICGCLRIRTPVLCFPGASVN
jgi:hypothetical protein